MNLPRSFYNTTSLVGVLIAILSLLLIIFLFVLAVFFDMGSTYMGLFIYIVMPALLVLGLLLIPFGMWRAKRRAKRLGTELEGRWDVIDLNNSRHRNAMLVFSIGSLIFLALTSFGSYEAFHYTESDEFCGTLCHKVMEPEHVAHQHSEHANVKCTQCHVGPGADWYVRSKISGLYQVYSVMFNKFPRPIETPVHNLPPAELTCQQCHWTDKAYPDQLRQIKRYLADEDNSEWNISLQTPITYNPNSDGRSSGVHWHNNPNVKIEYAARGKNLQEIPWVRYINLATGDTILYIDEDDPFEDEDFAAAEIKSMGCIDCHNRPAHKYLVPQEFFDKSMTSGEIPKDLPEVKKAAMEVFYSETFDTKEDALQIFTDRLNEFYEDNYPEILAERKADVDKAVKGIMAGFNRNYFPYMQVKWDAYPDNIGHKEFEGCFRCHSGRHNSESGQTISRDCQLCHTIVRQGTAEDFEVAPYGGSLEFKHPVRLKGNWLEGSCTECHSFLYE